MNASNSTNISASNTPYISTSANFNTPATTQTVQQNRIFLVRLSLAIPLSEAEFANSTLQQIFRVKMAVAAGLTKEDGDKVSLAVQSSQRRRLMGTNITVDVTIIMPNENAATLSVSRLTIENINAPLVSGGLPQASLVRSPTIESRTQDTTTSLLYKSNTPTPSTVTSNSSSNSSSTKPALSSGAVRVGLCPSFPHLYCSIVAQIMVFKMIVFSHGIS